MNNYVTMAQGLPADELGKWLLAAVFVGGAIAILFKVIGYFDEKYVSRREWDRIITENARHEKLLEHIERLIAAIAANKK